MVHGHKTPEGLSQVLKFFAGSLSYQIEGTMR